MIKSLLRVLLFFAYFLISFTSLASFTDFNIRNYNRERELEEVFIYDVYQSRDGYLIIATENGLFTFDGDKFTRVEQPNKTIITTVSENEKGEIIIAYSTGELYNVTLKKVVKRSDQSRIESLIIFDSTLLYIEDYHQIVTQQLDSDKKILHKSSSFFNFYSHYNNIVSFLVDDYVYIYNLQTKKLKKVRPYNNATTSKCLAISTTSYFLFDEENHVLKCKIDDRNVSSCELYAKLPNDIEITSLFYDHEGKLWVGTKYNGVFELDAGNEGIQDVIHNYDETQIEGAVHKIYQDDESNIWVATLGGGLYQLIPSIFPFQYLGKEPIDILGKESQVIVAFNDEIRSFRSGERELSFHDTQVLASFESSVTCVEYFSDTQMMIGTSAGVYLYNFIDKTISLQVFDVVNQHVLTLKRLNNGDMAISFLNGGCIIVDTSFQEKKRYSIENGFIENNINKIIEDHVNDNLWLILEHNGIVKIHHDEIDYLTQNKTVPNVKINGASLNEDGDLWLATDGLGILFFSVKENKLSRITSEQNLLSNYPSGVISFKNKIWAAFKNGTQKINSYNHLDTYRNIDHAIDTYTKRGGVFCVNDKLMLAGKKGIHFIDHHLDTLDHLLKKPYLQSIEINQKKVYTMPSLLAYDQNNISLKFACINLKGKDFFYRYKMKGLDSKWNISRQNPIIQYNALVPKKYQFVLQVSKDKYYDKIEELVLDIEIEKPFWSKWWFMCFQVAVLIIVAYILFLLSRGIHNRRIIRFLTYVTVFIIFEFVHELAEPYFLDSAKNIPLIKISLNLFIALSLYPIELFMHKVFTKKERKTKG